MGWRYGKGANADSLPRYTIMLPDTLKHFERADTLAISMALGNLSELKIKTDKKEKEKLPNQGFNFTVVLTDSLGRMAFADIAATNALPKTIKSKFTKFKFMDKKMMGQESEIQLKSCYVPISLFKQQNDSIQLNKLKYIQLLFDKDSLGVMVLDDLGFYIRP